MKTYLKKGIAGLGVASTLFVGGDVASFTEVPLDKVEVIKNERVEVKQIENTVETHLPWKGEAGIKVKYDMGDLTATERLKDKRDKQVIIESLPEGIKMDILLDKKPDTNTFCYQIEGYEDYNFFYQPALTAQEIAEGAIRREEIVGSYAVYHKTLKNHKVGGINYATGKFAHIPYPYIWEVNDLSTKQRAENFTIENGLMCVTAQQDFLDNANYPVRIDPTFGYAVQGESNFGSGVSKYKGTLGTPASAGDVTKISWYGYGFSADTGAKGGIYNDTALVVGSAETIMTDDTVPSLYEVNVSASITAIPYISVVQMESTGLMAFDTNIFNPNGYRDTAAYGTFVDPIDWDAASGENRDFSVYTTYTEAVAESDATETINNATKTINNATVIIN